MYVVNDGMNSFVRFIIVPLRKHIIMTDMERHQNNYSIIN